MIFSSNNAFRKNGIKNKFEWNFTYFYKKNSLE